MLLTLSQGSSLDVRCVTCHSSEGIVGWEEKFLQEQALLRFKYSSFPAFPPYPAPLTTALKDPDTPHMPHRIQCPELDDWSGWDGPLGTGPGGREDGEWLREFNGLL